MHPPASSLVADVFVENPTYCAVGEDVHGTVWRNVCHGAEDQWDVDLSHETRFGNDESSDAEEDNWQEEANEPKPLQVLVDGISGEQVLRPNGTPDDRGVVERLDVRAGKVAGSCRSANAFDGAKCPLHRSELTETRPDGCNGLRGEQRALWNVHVVAELQVLTEVQCLSHDNVAKRLEHHHGDGVAGLKITDDELGKYVPEK